MTRGRLVNVSDTASQAERAYHQLKHDIITCAIKPGQRFTEAELVERYAMGRASIRTALNRLSQEAFVDILPRYGYVIAGQEELDARDLFALQLILEPTAARLAAGRVNAKQLVELDQACADTSHVTSAEDAAEFLHANTAFHVAIAMSTGNALLARFVGILFERLERHIYASGRIEQIGVAVAHTHEELVRLLVEGRAADAEATAREQVSRNHQIILATISGGSGAQATM